MVNIENLITVRTMDDLGRIVLPVEIRHALGWGEKSSLEVYFDKEMGEVILKTHIDVCTYCGSRENLMEFKKKKVCSACQKAISEL